MLFELYDDNTIEATEVTKEIRLPFGSKILALPSEPDTIRGNSGSVAWDEADINRLGKKIWAAIMPIASNPSHKKIITSTPGEQGAMGLFYEFLTNPDLSHRWSRHYLDIYQCISQGLQRDAAALREDINDPILWEREFECKFITDSTTWFSPTLLATCQTPEAGIPESFENKGATFIGVDIAWNNNLWVAWVIERIGEMRFTREVSVIKFDGDTTSVFQRHDKELDRLVEIYRPRKISLDATGIGKKPVEDCIRRYGEYRVEGIDFTVATKYRLATALRKALEQQLITIPISDAVVKDFAKINRKVNSNGQVTFSAKNDKDGHSDRAWACSLAWDASQTVQLITPSFHGMSA